MHLISVITPHFRQLDKLKCCTASVADQSGPVEVEHIIEDGGSGDSFLAWAAGQSSVRWNSEVDDGMYSAINRGFRKAKGNIIAWLNADEQYLPGALAAVSRYFDEHPDVDILFGDVVLTDSEGTPLSYRKAAQPSLAHLRNCHLSTFSAATFVRSRILEQGIYLDEKWKVIADAAWVERILASGFRAGVLNLPIASFSMMGSNLGQSPLLAVERAEWERTNGARGKLAKAVVIIRHRLGKLLSGAYLPRQVSVALHRDGVSGRIHRTALLGGRWSSAKDSAEEKRTLREGDIVALGISRPVLGRMFYPVCFAIAAAVMALDLRVQEMVVGPFLLGLALLILAMKSVPRQMIIAAALFIIVAWWCLLGMVGYSVERHLLRLLTFAVTATLAVLWNHSLWGSEEWIRSAVAFIRNLPSPLLILNRYGFIVMANRKCQTDLGIEEGSVLGKQIDGLLPPGVPSFDSWGHRPPQAAFHMVLGESEKKIVAGEAFVVGRGRRRLYGIKLTMQND